MADADRRGEVDEKYGGVHAGPMSVRAWLRMLSCTMVIEKRLRRRFVERFATTLPRFDVLSALDRHPDGITMGELSQMLLVSNGNVTALVRQLQADGQVTLEQAPNDRRSLIACLTAKGRADFAEMAAAHHDWIGAMFTGLSEAQMKALYDLLAVVKTSVATEGKDV